MKIVRDKREHTVMLEIIEKIEWKNIFYYILIHYALYISDNMYLYITHI